MSIHLLECIGIKNPCYQKYRGINLVPVGIAVHTTDSPNPTIKRYVAPAPGQTEGLSDNGAKKTAAEMVEILGTNIYQNDWNKSTATAAVHAFIGKLVDGSIGVCQFLPWTQPCWGSGSGPNGSYNGCLDGKAKAPLFIQFEICEGPTSDLDYCRKTYNTAVQFAAMLCRMFPTISIDNILGHKEIYEQGKSSPRADPIKYWTACGSGYTMDKFRAAVKAAVQAADDAPADTIYRVQVGAFRNRVYAESYLKSVKAAGFENAYITVKRGK